MQCWNRENAAESLLTEEQGHLGQWDGMCAESVLGQLKSALSACLCACACVQVNLDTDFKAFIKINSKWVRYSDVNF